MKLFSTVNYSAVMHGIKQNLSHVQQSEFWIVGLLQSADEFDN